MTAYDEFSAEIHRRILAVATIPADPQAELNRIRREVAEEWINTRPRDLAAVIVEMEQNAASKRGGQS